MGFRPLRPGILAAVLLAVLLGPRPARAGEPSDPDPPPAPAAPAPAPAPAPVVPPTAVPADPAAVGRLLLSADPAERARGEALLLRRLREGGDLEAFLSAMSRAQASWADDEERLLARWIERSLHAPPAERERARRLVLALGPAATRRLLEALSADRAKARADAAAAADAEEPPPARPDGKSGPGVTPGPGAPWPPDAPPRVRTAGASSDALGAGRDGAVGLRIEVMLVPEAEIARRQGSLSPSSRTDSAADDVAAFLARLAGGEAASVTGTGAAAAHALLASLPDATLRPAPEPVVLAPGDEQVVVPADAVAYRRDVRRTAEGAWAVETDRLPRGLEVRSRLEDVERGPRRLVLDARWIEVPSPLPTRRFAPAPDVEPLEVDVPEWRSARRSVTVEDPPADGEVLVALPSLAPGRTVVLHLFLAAGPLPPAPRVESAPVR